MSTGLDIMISVKFLKTTQPSANIVKRKYRPEKDFILQHYVLRTKIKRNVWRLIFQGELMS